MTDESEELIPYFIPSLSAILVNAEDEKGSPLEYDEVITIRDKSTCIMMESADAKKMDESRGYVDVDPENLWYDWQILRREMERKPDIDPGPSFNLIESSSDDYQKTIREARNSLPDFRAMLPQDGTPRFEAMEKLRLSDGENSAYMWLANTRIDGDGFVAEIFEVPEFFKNVEVGQAFNVSSDEIVDWMVNEGGILFGGFSLRLHRSTLSNEEQRAYDEHIGVSKYA